jgi:hypothetical protein
MYGIDSYSGSVTTSTTKRTLSYVALNKIGRFLLWMDLCWKNAFGKMLVIGSVAPFRVKGLRSLP